MKFKFKDNGPKAPKCGPHRIGDVTYVPGDVIETDSDLAARFPSKFERADSQGKAAKSGHASIKATTVSPKLPMDDFGKDVTANFAVPDGYVVYHDATIKYTVIDVVGNQIVRLGLKNATAVEEFLEALRTVAEKEVNETSV